MIGAIAGDVIGSRFEFNNVSHPDFELFSDESTFTDDTVLSIATAEAFMGDKNYLAKYQEYFNMYPHGRGWGGNFAMMASTGKLEPYNSYGNGAAMRVNPIGWCCNSFDATLEEAKKTAAVTHNHPEGIKGAQATAIAMYMARTGATKGEIRDTIQNKLQMYDLSPRYYEYPKVFDETCQGTVPLSLALFLDTDSYDEAIRLSITNGGDVDTIACIVGGIAEAYYGSIDNVYVQGVYSKLTEHLRGHLTKFILEYVNPYFIEPQIILPFERDIIQPLSSPQFSN